MKSKTAQLILIRKGRTLLTLWEDFISEPKESYIVTRVSSHLDFTRPMIDYVLKDYNQKTELIGVEIGVAAGDNAFDIMNVLDMKRLYLIDPYSLSEYPEYKPSDQPQFDKVRDTAFELLSQYKNRVEFIIKPSRDAVDDVPDNLDFIYIDGNHEYIEVRADLENYYPKVKKGGIFGGDNFESECPGVAGAVWEFAVKHNLDILGARSPLSYEWWVIKK